MKSKHFEELQEKVVLAAVQVQEHKALYLAKQRELMDVETKFIEAKEALIAANDAVYNYYSTKIGENSLAEWRDYQVADFKTRLEATMEKIKNEKAIKPLYLLDLKS